LYTYDVYMRQCTALCMCNVIYQWATHGWVYTSVCVTWRVWYDALVLATQRMRMRQDTFLYVCRDISTSKTWGSVHLCMCDVIWSIHISHNAALYVWRDWLVWGGYGSVRATWLVMCDVTRYVWRDSSCVTWRQTRPVPIGKETYWCETYCYKKRDLNIRGKRKEANFCGMRPICMRWDLFV